MVVVSSGRGRFPFCTHSLIIIIITSTKIIEKKTYVSSPCSSFQVGIHSDAGACGGGPVAVVSRLYLKIKIIKGYIKKAYRLETQLRLEPPFIAPHFGSGGSLVVVVSHSVHVI